MGPYEGAEGGHHSGGPQSAEAPLQTVTDREGRSETVLRAFIQELHAAGIEIGPDDRGFYEEAAGRQG